MIVERNVVIPASDGGELRANIFRPEGDGPHPVILSHGVYGKDIHFMDWRPPAWAGIKRQPAIMAGSSGLYMNWETVDPERWVPFGYAIVRVDARGSGRSEGQMDIYSERDGQDMYDTVEWAASQEWSTGKVAMVGISYYAIASWRVASLAPPHLAAIVPWEGWADQYRDRAYHGGILSDNFIRTWVERSVLPSQHGNPKPAGLDPVTGELPTGPEVLSDEELRANRVDFLAEVMKHRLDDDWHHVRGIEGEKLTIPLLSAGNWGGLGLHLRGNIEGYLAAASKDKWLEVHTGSHWQSFFAPEGVQMMRRFLDHFLKGADNGWQETPRVQLSIRRPDGETRRAEHEWPIARTQWTPYYLDLDTATLGTEKPTHETSRSYDAMSDGVTFVSAPFAEETEITGPVSVRLWGSSPTEDMDVFVTVRAYDPQLNEVTFEGASDPKTPVSQGWLRASHRSVDEERSIPGRPFHDHSETVPLVPGEVVCLDVEVWATSMVFPVGYRLALTVQGMDFQRPGPEGSHRGSARFLHIDPIDRDPAVFDTINTLHSDSERQSYILLPVIPS